MAQSFIVRLPVAYIMSRTFTDSLVYIGMAAPLATVFGILINLVYFIPFSRRELARSGERPAAS
jgi:Na+-driven multidrug efflux pump